MIYGLNDVQTSDLISLGYSQFFCRSRTQARFSLFTTGTIYNHVRCLIQHPVTSSHLICHSSHVCSANSFLNSSLAQLLSNAAFFTKALFPQFMRSRASVASLGALTGTPLRQGGGVICIGSSNPMRCIISGGHGGTCPASLSSNTERATGAAESGLLKNVNITRAMPTASDD